MAEGRKEAIWDIMGKEEVLVGSKPIFANDVVVSNGC